MLPRRVQWSTTSQRVIYFFPGPFHRWNALTCVVMESCGAANVYYGIVCSRKPVPAQALELGQTELRVPPATEVQYEDSRAQV
jgi:hypothetical protein